MRRDEIPAGETVEKGRPRTEFKRTTISGAGRRKPQLGLAWSEKGKKAYIPSAKSREGSLQRQLWPAMLAAAV